MYIHILPILCYYYVYLGLDDYWKFSKKFIQILLVCTYKLALKQMSPQ